MPLRGQGFIDGHVGDPAVLHADDLVGHAVAQKLDREVARLKGEGAVPRSGLWYNR